MLLIKANVIWVELLRGQIVHFVNKAWNFTDTLPDMSRFKWEVVPKFFNWLWRHNDVIEVYRWLKIRPLKNEKTMVPIERALKTDQTLLKHYGLKISRSWDTEHIELTKSGES